MNKRLIKLQKQESEVPTTDIASVISKDQRCASRNNLQSLNYPQQTVQIAPQPMKRSNHCSYKGLQRRSSYTEGVELSLNKGPTKRKSRNFSYSRGWTPEKPSFSSKKQNRINSTFFDDSSQIQRKNQELWSNMVTQHHIQLLHYRETYKDTSFSLSEITHGIRRSSFLNKQPTTVNNIVQKQFEPILNYEFSKLTRKDIIPSLSYDQQSPPQSCWQEERMSLSLKSQLFPVYRSSNSHQNP